MGQIGQLILDPLLWRDRDLSRRLSRWRAPRWVRIWMILATRGGDGWLWWGLGAGVALCGGPERWHAFFAAGLSAAIAVGSFKCLKRLTRRSRPIRSIPHCWAAVPTQDEFSFPSGHTLTAFAVVAAMLCWYPGAAPLLLFCAFSVAASRVVLGLHFLTDVLAGGLLGTVLGLACAALFLR